MADSVEMDLVIRALSEGFEKLSGDLDKLGKSTEAPAEPAKKTSLSFTELKSALDLVSGAVKTTGAALKEAFDFGMLGAQVNQTADSFGMLINVIGASPDLLDQLKNAAGGTISDLKLMSATSTLLAGAQGDVATALANATPRLIEIARAANKLNPSLGETTYLYESLATGIKRSSPLILDNLGLTIKLGDANETMAESLGKTVEQLTAGEKQQALLNATLAAGEVLINQVGGSVESATDSYTSFTASMDNLKASAAGLFAEMETGQVILEGWSTEFELQTALIEAHKLGIISTSEAIGIYLDVAASAGHMDEARQKALEDLTSRIKTATTETNYMTDAMIEHAAQVAATNTVTRTWADSSFYAEQAQNAARDATLAAKDAMEAGAEAAKNIASAFSGVGLAAYEAEVYTTLLKVATGDLSAADAELQLNLLDVKQALANGTITLGEYFAAMLDGQITTEEYSALLGDQKAALDDTEAAFLANTQTAKDYQSTLNELDGTVVNVEVRTTYTSNGGGGSGTENTPNYDQRIGDPTGGATGLPATPTDYQAIYAAMSNEEKRRVQDIVGMSMYEGDWINAIKTVSKTGGGKPRGRGITVPSPSPKPGAGGGSNFAVAESGGAGGSVMYANQVIINATYAEMTGGGESGNFETLKQQVS